MVSVIDATDCEGVYFQDIEAVLTMDDYMIDTLFKKTKRPIRRYVQIAYLEQLRKTRLHRGRGMFLKGDGHAMAMWRDRNGDYFFFDSCAPDVVPPEVVRFLRGRKFRQYRYPLQAPHLATCAQHCIAFLDFITKHRSLHVGDILRLYPLYLRLDLDVHVCLLVERMLHEVHFDGLYRIPMIPIFLSYYRLVQPVFYAG